MNFYIIPFEYDCGKNCTPTGCHGHENDKISLGFEIDGELFFVEGADCGDYPNFDKPEKIEKVNNIIKKIEKGVALLNG
jgi:hypothetical protein